MNTGLESEAEQFDWLASDSRSVDGKPVALFLHKPLYLNTPDDPELEASAIRYVPQPARRRLIEMFGAVDLRLVASRPRPSAARFHLWPCPPCLGAVCRLHHSRHEQEVIGMKETGLVEYRFAPDSFEVRHVRAPGQVDVGLDELLGKAAKD